MSLEENCSYLYEDRGILALISLLVILFFLYSVLSKVTVEILDHSRLSPCSQSHGVTVDDGLAIWRQFNIRLGERRLVLDMNYAS